MPALHAVGGATATGLELVRALVEVRSAMGWYSPPMGDKVTPDFIIELLESEDGGGAWLLFDPKDLPGLKFTRELARCLGATLEVVRFEFEPASGRSRVTEGTVDERGNDEEDTPDSYDASGDEKDGEPAEYVRRGLVASLDLTGPRVRSRFPYHRSPPKKRRRQQ